MTNDYNELPLMLLQEGHTIKKSAWGDSMLPAIPAKTVVKIAPVSSSIPKPGQVALIRSLDGNTKIHRISMVFLRNSTVWVQTWGDNCEKPDAAIPAKQVLGYVTAYKQGCSWKTLSSQWEIYLKLFFTCYFPHYFMRIVCRNK